MPTTIPYATLEEAARLHDAGVPWRAISAQLHWDHSGMRKLAKAAGLVHCRSAEAAAMHDQTPTPRWKDVAERWGYVDAAAACHAAFEYRKRQAKKEAAHSDGC